MTPKDIVLSQLTSAQWLYENASKDFTEADAKFQPFPGGNHLNWILAHLAVSEDGIIAKITGKPLRYSETLHKAYNGQSTCTPEDGMTKAEAWKMYTECGKNTAAFLREFPESKYGDKAPQGFPELFPNVGAVIGLLGAHPFWHFGQLTVNRRMLKKPSLFGG